MLLSPVVHLNFTFFILLLQRLIELRMFSVDGHDLLFIIYFLIMEPEYLQYNKNLKV